MAEATAPSDYDKLFITKMMFFIAIIVMCNIAVVTGLYTFLWQSPFYEVLAQERDSFARTLNASLHQTMRFNGDMLYDGALVKTGIESGAYGFVLEKNEDDIASDALQDLKVFGTILDNLFDYFLLLSHRVGFLSVAMTYVICLVIAVGIHGAIIRHRKRYGFGDTPILMNVWARATLAYSIPVTVIIWSLPFALNPYLLVASLTCCVMGLAVFSFSLPKIA